MKISELTKAFRLDGEMQIPVTLFGQNLRISVGQLASAMCGLQMRLSYGGDTGMRPGDTLDVECTVWFIGEDVTGQVESWKATRDSGDASADAAWGIENAGFAGVITLRYDDIGPSGKVTFLFEASIGSGPDGRPLTAREAIEIA